MAASPPPAATTDFVIIGGGLAGLSTAIELAKAQPGCSIALLEAKVVGYGASGRNGGLLSPLPAPIWLFSAGRNKDHTWALRQLNEDVAAVANWLAAELPGSEIQRCRLRIEAAGPILSSGLQQVAQVLSHAGIAHELTPDRSGQRSRNLELMGHTVQPYNLVRALAAYATRLGVRIHQHTAVAAIEQAAAGAVVGLAAGGRIRASSVVVCTNAYTGSLTLPDPVRAAVRAKVMHNYMVATDPLGADALRALGGGNAGDAFTVELNRAYVFYRMHAGRLLFGGIDKVRPGAAGDFDVPPPVLAQLKVLLGRSFGQGPQLELSHAWGGQFHVTKTELPIIQRVAETPSVVLNVGYGGTGVALTLVCARMAASLAAGQVRQAQDTARLFQIMQATRLPVVDGLKFAGDVAWRVLTGGPAKNP